MAFEIDKLGGLRFIEKSSVDEKVLTELLRANEKPEIVGLRFSLGSGEWIRTTDLRVMREKPDFGNFDRITTQISQLYVLRFRRPKQSAVVYKFSYSKSFSGGSQVLFCYFSAFSSLIQSLKSYLPRCRGST